MIAAKRSDFFYTLNEDEKKCLASIEKIDREVWKEEALKKLPKLKTG